MARFIPDGVGALKETMIMPIIISMVETMDQMK